MNSTFSLPPILRGNEAQQAAQLRDYLVAMARQLNVALTSLDESNFVTGSTAQKIVSGKDPGPSAVAHEQALRDLIISSANIVQSSIDTLETQLKKQVAYTSDYGSFKESVTTDIYADPEGVTMASKYFAQMQTALENYESATAGYIRAGFVGDDGLTPTIGIAIGQDLKTKTAEVEGTGERYEMITSPYRAVFTANRLMFYQGDTPVAYLSNNKLYISSAHITGKLDLGLNGDDPRWEISMSNGFTIKWLG